MASIETVATAEGQVTLPLKVYNVMFLNMVQLHEVEKALQKHVNENARSSLKFYMDISELCEMLDIKDESGGAGTEGEHGA